MREIKLSYALYGRISDITPMVRVNSLKEAKDEYLSSRDYSMIICEVSELRNDKMVITQERVIKSPQIWLPADRFIPEFDDDYLCFLVRDEGCGNVTKWKGMISFDKMAWQISIGTRTTLTHWMIVEDPVIKKYKEEQK